MGFVRGSWDLVIDEECLRSQHAGRAEKEYNNYKQLFLEVLLGNGKNSLGLYLEGNIRERIFILPLR